MAQTPPHAVTLPSLRPVFQALMWHAALGGAMAFGYLLLIGARPGLGDALICALPAAAVLALGQTSQADRDQYVARLFAVAVMMPFALAFWASGKPDSVSTPQLWALTSAWQVLQLLNFLGVMLPVVRHATRLEPAAGCGALPAVAVASRLLALPAAGWPMTMQPGPQPGTWVVMLGVSEDGTRLHRLRLDLDTEQRQLHVLEDLSARGARPQSADEASMRDMDEYAWDPTRPQAQRVAFRYRQATIIDIEALAAVPAAAAPALVPSAAGHELPPCTEANLRGRALVTLLASVVLRSGWAWQPGLRLRAGRWKVNAA